MEFIHCSMILLTVISLLFSHQLVALPPNGSPTPARALDSLLQDYAYQAFDRPHTGVPYDGIAPSNVSGIKIAVLRLRNGSFRNRGFRSYKEFEIPIGVIVQPYVRRLALVYHNLGNWSSVYYALPPGYSYLTPVIGFLAYNAENISSSNLPELDLWTSKLAIWIRFSTVKAVPNGMKARQGHFSIVVNSSGLAPSPALSQGLSPEGGERDESVAWKIIGAVIGGIMGLILVAFFVALVATYRRKRKVEQMERDAEVAEALDMAQVGSARAPVAIGTRTRPVELEDEYVP
ncbi:uncharacterized protein [Elaeis guineensis]|uniref:uncharacterized protein isoform X2 n=1 Tax=Elaeis guineensis var. tenera TaxID=51953 RepID=UPI003C6D4697